jgi:hypothetical protein
MVPTMDITPVPPVSSVSSGARASHTPPDTAFLLTELDVGLQAELRLETNRARQIRLTRLRCLVDTLRSQPGDPVV